MPAVRAGPRGRRRPGDLPLSRRRPLRHGRADNGVSAELGGHVPRRTSFPTRPVPKRRLCFSITLAVRSVMFEHNLSAATSWKTRPTMMHPTIAKLISAGPVVTDGAWGTQLQERGLPLGACPDAWNLTQPEKVEQVARAYVEAGSRVILTNTFGANRFILARHGSVETVGRVFQLVQEVADQPPRAWKFPAGGEGLARAGAPVNGRRCVPFSKARRPSSPRWAQRADARDGPGRARMS